jgi:hypothetical protein
MQVEDAAQHHGLARVELARCRRLRDQQLQVLGGRLLLVDLSGSHPKSGPRRCDIQVSATVNGALIRGNQLQGAGETRALRSGRAIANSFGAARRRRHGGR